MIKIFKKLNKKQYILILITVALVFSTVWLELKMPEYMSTVTRLVQTPGSKMEDIWNNGLYMLLCALGAILLSVLTGYIVAYITTILSFNIRKELFDKVLSLSQNKINKFSTSSLITRTTNDVTQVELFIGMGLIVILRSPIMSVWAITKILGKGIEWSIATGVAVLIMLFVVLLLFIFVVPKIRLLQKSTDKLNSVLRENLSGIRVVRAFNAEEYQEEKIEEVNTQLTNLQKFTQKSFAIMQPMMFTLMFGLTLAIYLIGGMLISDATFSNKIEIFGNMIVFSAYSMQVMMSFLMLAFMIIFMSRAQVSSARINEVLDTKSDLFDGEFSSDTDMVGSVEFKDVSFKFDGAENYVLENITFKADKGEKIAFIGSTGSGKSTILNLVSRFFDVTRGEILVDGVNIKDYKLENLYNKLGYVSQKAVMFNMSVKDNIEFGETNKEITDDTIRKSLEIAQAEGFVSEMNDGINSNIARGGTNISGGQKQRLSIARAIARKPEIFLFDDTFSALDFKTESTLRKELEEYTKNSTSLIVSSRVGTVLNADKIIVLNEGKIECMGNHKELWNTCELYREIALSQLSEEELNESTK